ncbi:MAG: hypothetical protein M3N49_03590 [Candidatus Eremiobacteraeota bacterium]|nr:hypothetical protein [Candidatus Eremiobacteraeota bacterium]
MLIAAKLAKAVQRERAALPHHDGAGGNLYFTEPGVNRTTNKIGRITPTGTITEFAIPTALSGPVFIAAGPDNTIWFTEGSATKIGELFL